VTFVRNHPDASLVISVVLLAASVFFVVITSPSDSYSSKDTLTFFEAIAASLAGG
jgi:hypothetical protein